MLKFFNRTRPTPTTEPKTSIEDVIVLRWYGYTLDEWDALPPLAKVDRREGYYQAKGMGA